jgi:hypothetical protein
MVAPAVASATPSPNGGGQPGSIGGTTCQVFTTKNGNAMNAPGSPFNPNGIAGLHYAGNPGTASLMHSNSTHAVAEYDIACFQNTTH